MRSITGRIIFLFAILVSNAVADSGITVERNDNVQGLLQSDYVNMWWQWAVSMPNNESPIKDRSGTKCAVNQEGPVWFLAGGYGSSKISRKCSIPFDKHIFFPVINMLYYPRGVNSSPSCESVKKMAAMNNQYLRSFRVLIDDRKILNPVFYRHASQTCFDLAARKNNSTEYTKIYPSATDGYWVMLKPLPIGPHRISFRAEYDRPGGVYGLMVQDIEYEINVYNP